MHPHIDTHTHTHFSVCWKRVFFSKDISLNKASNFYLVLNPIERTFCLSVCACVLCVCMCWGGGICVFERETEIDRDRKKERKPRRQREREFFFFSGRKNSHRYMFQLPQKKDPMQKHFFEYSSLICVKVKSENEVAQLCPTLRDPMDCSPPGSSVHGIFQARVLEWVATAFSDAHCYI